MFKSKNRSLAAVSVFVYAVLFSLMIFSTVKNGAYDLLIDKALFNPKLSVAEFFEYYGQAVAWAMWGPAFAVVFLCRRDLNGCLSVINRLTPFVKPFENVDRKIYKVLDLVLKAVETVGFFVLCTVGWKKLIENVTKNALKNAGKDNLSQGVYFIISIAVAFLSIVILSRFNKATLRKLEGIALSFILFGVCYKIVEECKTITHRVRFREMIAYSNGFFNDEGLSEGRYSPLTAQMIGNTDFGAFSVWYKKSVASGAYDYHLFNRTDSFPSGHTICASVVFLSYVVFNAFEKLKKYSVAALLFSLIFVGFMGYTRLVMGAHYLSDVVGAMIIGYTLFLAVNNIYSSFSQRKILYG